MLQNYKMQVEVFNLSTLPVVIVQWKVMLAPNKQFNNNNEKNNFLFLSAQLYSKLQSAQRSSHTDILHKSPQHFIYLVTLRATTRILSFRFTFVSLPTQAGIYLFLNTSKQFKIKDVNKLLFNARHIQLQIAFHKQLLT